MATPPDVIECAIFMGLETVPKSRVVFLLVNCNFYSGNGIELNTHFRVWGRLLATWKEIEIIVI